MPNAETHLKVLGKNAVDAVTKFKGIAESVYFSIDGYIHVAVGTVAQQKGGDPRSMWFDINRLQVTGKPVMKTPSFSFNGPLKVVPEGVIDVKFLIPHLGLLATDPITQIEGVITGIFFDLYGCVQVELTPTVTNGEVKTHFFHFNRVTLGKRVIEKIPDFFPEQPTTISKGNQGPAFKPPFPKIK